MLESPLLAQVLASHNGEHAAQYATLQATLAAEAGASPSEPATQRLLSFNQYNWLAALVTTRAFTFWVDPHDTALGQQTWLLPGLDLVNCQLGALNVWRSPTAGAGGSLGSVEMRAEGSVRKGEELFWTYHDGNPRTDSTLLLYGMVDAADTRLAAVDTPGCAC
jgi:hypothetical protein